MEEKCLIVDDEKDIREWGTKIFVRGRLRCLPPQTEKRL